MIKSSLFGGYKDRRMFRIFLIGMISGFPWVLIGSALTLWLKEDGLSRTTVGFAGLIFSVYAINFLWAPLLDKLRIPYLSAQLGARKAWIFTFQAIIMLAVTGWTFLEPAQHLTWVIGLGLVMAIASASQDITLDALRIEQVDAHERDKMAAGAAMTVIGWWTGFKLGGLVTLYTADILQHAGYTNYWQLSFLAILVMMLAMNIGLWLVPEHKLAHPPGSSSAPNTMLTWLLETVLHPLSSFFKANGLKLGIAILSFVFLFKIGEAFMGKMSIVFYRELGFSKSDIGLYSKGVGWLTTVGFTVIGGMVAMRFGTVRALFFAGIAMAGTNVMFSILAWTGNSVALFAFAVIVDDLAAAFANVAFVTFISLLVDRRYTATQYALLASIGTAGRTLFASSSGLLVDGLDGNWGVFFIITALMVVPSLILLWYLRDIFTQRKP